MKNRRHDSPDTSSRSRGATPVGKGHRILLAEDDAEMLKVVAWALRHEGYVVDECHDGAVLKKQLDRSGTRSTNVAYDLIVSDIRMPGLSGLEVLEHAEERGDRPPMVLISAFVDRETEDRARRLGAASLLAKPFATEELLETVGRLMPD